MLTGNIYFFLKYTALLSKTFNKCTGVLSVKLCAVTVLIYDVLLSN